MIKNTCITAAILAILLTGIQDARAVTAGEIIDESEKKMRGNTMVSVIDMTIKTRRWTRVLRMKSWENRLADKSFAEILAPAKDAGNRFLLVGNQMWHYQPKIQKTIKIAPSMMLQSWMGSDFTYDDIVKQSSILEDYNHIMKGKKSVDGYECYEIELKPKPNAAVVWGKITYYARVSDYLPVKQEFYNQHEVLKKVLTYSRYREMDNRVIPTLYKMVTVNKEDQYTLMEIKAVNFNVNIPNYVFTLQNLQRR